jgi:glycosyltransferase involved in cell wall biosynthesis
MISIITINLNNSNGLLSTLLSVLQHKNKCDFEYIVVDGLSIDDSKDLLLNYSNSIDILISEKDQGIYNAMNKGIRFCTNDYVLFLNSGDYFVKSINFTNLLNNNFDLIYGDILDCGDLAKHKVTYPDKLSFNYMLCGGLPHQATLIRKTLFDKVGFYEERYKIISDWVFFMEALFYHNATYKHVPYVISVYEGGGLSSMSNSTYLILWEQIDYINKRFPNSINYYKSNSPYVKKYLRQKSRIFRWFYKFLLFKFNTVIK